MKAHRKATIGSLLTACMLLLALGLGTPAFGHGTSHQGAPAGGQAGKAGEPAPRGADPAAIGNPADPHADHGAASGARGAPGDGADHPGPGGDAEMTMLHPGLPLSWIAPAAIAMLAIALWGILVPAPLEARSRSVNLAALPFIGPVVRFLNRSPYPLLAAKFVSAALFLLVIAAGLFGTRFPERNLATIFVWNLWWPLVVVSVFFIGSAWCSVCPWDTLSGWIVRRRLWRRIQPHPGLNLKVPAYLRNLWIAMLMLMGLTWLELGFGVTTIPFATALMGLAMLVLALLFLLVFERKAFCKHVCPVGRTLGFYSRLAPISVRAVDQSICDRCKTLECYNGSQHIEPCPTHLTIGRFSQNTFCLSCGNCVLSCPHRNVTWRLRTMGSEAKENVRPQWDGAWFMLALLGITSFHGLTMMPYWGDWVSAIAGAIGESGRPFASFSVGMLAGIAVPVSFFAGAAGLVHLHARRRIPYRAIFSVFSFAALPLAFAFHLAHNMDHLVRESPDLLSVVLNPLGTGVAPLSSAERHARMMDAWLPEEAMFVIQSVLMVLGFWLAVQIARYRARDLSANGWAVAGWKLLPILGFIGAVAAMNFWLMAQDMEMRF